MQLVSRQARVGRPAPAPTQIGAAEVTWQQDVLAALLHGPWSREALNVRIAQAMGRLTANPGLTSLVDEILRSWPARPDEQVLRAFLADRDAPDDSGWTPAPVTTRQPLPGQHRPHLPMSRVLTRTDLIRILDLTEGELDWFADRQGRLSRNTVGPLLHYRYRVQVNTGRSRLLEIPKPRLKEIQRRLLHHVLERLPLHHAAHGSVTGRSVRSCITEHCAAPVVVRCDLESFFATITDDRVRGQIAVTGADAETARFIASLCTAAVPAGVRAQLPKQDGHTPAQWRLDKRLATPHLPQGAPSSPALANAIAFSMDHRLTSLAQALGARYTRYVDDLIFSGPADLAVGALLAATRAIATDEGFRLAERKTAVLRSARQQKVLGGGLERQTRDSSSRN